MAKKNTIPATKWEQQALQFELGSKHATQIAMELGVSPQTVYREMKRRGARKNALLHKSVADIERYYDGKARHRDLMRLSELEKRQKIAAATMQAMELLMRAIIQADIDGDICKANAVIEPLADALGVNCRRSRRRA